MARARWFAAVAMVWAAWAGPAAGEPVIPRAADAPKLDGRLDEAAWGSALRLTGFTLPGRADRPAKGVEARTCFDKEALYLAFVCLEPNPKALRARATVEDDDVWKDDCVEVWIRCGYSTHEFDQFIVNTLGTRQTLRRRQGREQGSKGRTWRAAAAVEAHRWVAELKIPFADLGIPAPGGGHMIQMKLGREDHTGAKAILSTWPSGSPYAGTEGYAPVYFERANLLANPDMSRRREGKVVGWSFHKSDAGLFSSVDDGPRRVIRFRAPGRYTTANQSVRLVPDARYRLEAKVRGSAGIYLRARTAPKVGARTNPYTGEVPAGAAWRHFSVPFPSGPTGKGLILIGNTEGGGAGEVYVADLRVIRVASYDVFGPAVPVVVGDRPTVLRKLAVADCRVLKGFLGVPVDGTARSRGWDGGVWEYGRRGAGAGVWYDYRANDGLHVTLAEAGGFDAIQILGGARVRVHRDCPRYDDPAGGVLLADLPGRTTRSRVWLDKPADTRRVSFFGLADGLLADVTFLRVRRGAAGLPKARRLLVGGACRPNAIEAALADRFEKAERRCFAFGPDARNGAAIRLEKGQGVHLLGRPMAAETPLAAVGLDLDVDGLEPIPLTVAVQDPLNPRSRLFGADVAVSRAGPCRLVMDFPDQIVPKGAALWLTVTADAPVTLRSAAVELYPVTRAAALPEALAYRKLLLKTYFVSLSEARPWNGWYDDRRMNRSLASAPYGPQLRELAMTLGQCKKLDASDGLVRQYDEWIYRRHRGRRESFPAFEPRIDEVPGAPRWAVVARQAWLTARDVPRWWIENRMVPTGEMGGRVGDDSDMYQNYADFPMFEVGGVAARVRDGARRLMELADRTTLTAGLNTRTMDPLHAYEEGLNQEALLAWWNYGDPVAFERCLLAARSTEALTVLTPKGHRHFKSQLCGAADLKTDRKTDVDGHAHPLMWHPTLEVAWYNANPRALEHLRQWADGWLAHMRPGKYATSVEVATERVTATTDRPVYGGYGALGSALIYLYWITGDQKYLGPFFEAFRKGSRNTSPNLILPELIHRHGLGFLGEQKLRRLVAGEGAAETLVTGDKQPLIDALSADVAELQRFGAMYTTAEPFTDRVFLYAVRNAAITYTGGYASRNKLHHTHAVSWGRLGTEYAAIVLKARRDALKLLVYNFADHPQTAEMRVWTLDHGDYRLRAGTDADGDDRPDRLADERTLRLLRASPVALTLPPKQVTVVELTQLRRLDDERLRADLAICPAEIRVEGGAVRGVVHNIGSRDAPAFEVALIDATGKVRARKRLAPLPAPLDLVPRRAPFQIGPLPAAAKGWSLAVDPDNRIPEIHEPNNRAPVGRP